MKRVISARRIAFLLLIISLLLYGLDYYFFGGGAIIAAGFLGNLAFLPLYVLFVTLIIEKVLKERERHAIRQKLNMVIGVFFSEVGTAMLRDCLGFVLNPGELSNALAVTPHWTYLDFRKAADYLHKHSIDVESRQEDLTALKKFLVEKRGFMLVLLENPNLLEHNEFTDLLWAVFHLIEELEARRSLEGLSSADLDHLSGDIKRAYSLLLREWLAYIQHLKQDYPYLFSLAVRTNPLNPDARAEIS
jgi:hypothetical protein